VTNEEKSMRLQLAAALVKQVTDDMDATATTCDCCGAAKFNHYGEKKAHEILAPLHEKLLRVAGSVKAGLNKTKVTREQD
jgi:hypothetical protein